MDYNWEESRSLLGDRNQNRLGIMVTSSTTSAPIYVQAAPVRGSLPNLQTVQSSFYTDHTLRSGDVPVFNERAQTSDSCGYSYTTAQPGITHQRQAVGSVNVFCSSPYVNTGIRNWATANLNANTHPTGSTAARCSVTQSEFMNNPCLVRDTQVSFGNRAYHRFLGSSDQFWGSPSTKGIKPGTYDGTGNCSDYLIQFNLIADYWHWNDYEKALHLAINLRGTAQSVLADLRHEQRTNFRSLSSALAARFEPVQQSELHRVTLKTRLRRAVTMKRYPN